MSRFDATTVLDLVEDIAEGREAGVQLRLAPPPPPPKSEPVTEPLEAEPVEQAGPDGPGTAIIPKNVVAEICGARNAAVELYAKFFDLLEDAHRTLAEAHAMALKATDGEGLAYLGDQVREVEEFHRAIKPPNVEQHKRTARRLLDIQVWASVIERTRLRALMDATAKEELRRQMRYVPEEVDRESGKLINAAEIAKGLPPVSEEAIHATLEKFTEDAGMIWRRGIAKAFTELDRRFRSHDGFKIGSRIILSRCFDEYGNWSWSSHHRGTLADIERVFLVLDGRSPEDCLGIVETVRRERDDYRGPRQSSTVGTYFEVRGFKNGNAHLWFTRKDLLEKVNLLLAEYYGAGLGWGREQEPDPERPLEGTLARAPAKNFGLFPTPDELADKVIEKLMLWSEEPLEILEPSAGTGQLARRAAAYQREQREQNATSSRWGRKPEPITAPDHRVTAVEIQPDLAANLRREGVYTRVLCRDFLAVEPEPIFDRVVMNPPFDRDRDIDHVNHALGFLKPGGVLVAIMSASTEFAESPKALAFRAKVEGLKGRFEDLPAGSFRECGTNVNTSLLIIGGRNW